MLRVFLVVMLLAPCPGCCLGRVSALSQEASSEPAATWVDCDCCEHAGLPGSPLSPEPESHCPCDDPVVSTLTRESGGAHDAFATLPEFAAAPRSGLPDGVFLHGHTQLGYSTGSPRSSPLRR